AVDEFDAARRTARVAAARMEDIHMRILLDGKHESLAVGDIDRWKTFNAQAWHRVAMLTYRFEWPTPQTCLTSLVRRSFGNNCMPKRSVRLRTRSGTMSTPPTNRPKPSTSSLSASSSG